jgi:hypothetical protein
LTTLAKAKARANETFIAQVSLMIVTYNRQNIFIVKATGNTKRIGRLSTVDLLIKMACFVKSE